jgi:ADP-heptose:LPS heptosyltransferase
VKDVPYDLSLLNKTTLDDLIAIFHLCGIVVGSSSGPMHLAAATGTPHVVWGGGRSQIRARYTKNWNPFKVPVDHLSLSFSVKDSAITGALTRMADNKYSISTNR